MSSIFEPLSKIDRYIQRQYTKIGKKWEDKGHSRYSLAIPLNICGILVGSVFNITESSIQPFKSFLDSYNSTICGWDLYSNLRKLPYGTKDTVHEDIKHPLVESHKKIDRVMRLSAFTAGIFFMGKGTYALYNHIRGSVETDLSETFNDLQIGFGMFCTASSFYIKDIDPKLLNREPTLNTIKGKLQELLQPTPQPAPVRSCESIEELVN